MTNVISLASRQPLVQRERHENALEHARREPPALPAWVTSDYELSHKIMNLWEAGWKVRVVAHPCTRWVEFRHHQVKPVGRDYLYLDEAIDTQRMMDATRNFK